MSRHVFACLSAVLWLGLNSAALHGQAPEAELLPPPREVVPTFVTYAQFRTDRYQVWQYYDVDRFGRFRPLVVSSPYGAYYPINGAPFPWTVTHPQEIKRVLVGGQ